jgi:hypothetical protein
MKPNPSIAFADLRSFGRLSPYIRDDRYTPLPDAGILHESAHGVIGAVVGAKIREATATHVDFDDWNTLPPSVRIAILHSGGAVSRRLGLSPGDRDDNTRINEIAIRFGINPEGARQWAEQLIDRHWRSILAMANRLARGPMSGSEVSLILQRNGDVDLLLTGTPVPIVPKDTIDPPYKKTPEEEELLKKQKETGEKKLEDTEDFEELDGQVVEAENTESDPNELEEKEQELLKKTKVVAGGRAIGAVYHYRGGRFVAVLHRGGRRVKVGAFRDPGMAARAL